MKRLLTGLELSDMKPSQLLRKMKSLGEDISVKMLRTLWFEKMTDSLAQALISKCKSGPRHVLIAKSSKLQDIRNLNCLSMKSQIQDFVLSIYWPHWSFAILQWKNLLFYMCRQIHLLGGSYPIRGYNSGISQQSILWKLGVQIRVTSKNYLWSRKTVYVPVVQESHHYFWCKNFTYYTLPSPKKCKNCKVSPYL